MADQLFQFHKLNDGGIKNAVIIADAFTQLLETLKRYCPEGREFSIVKTKLEEASFFSKKAMAVKEENQLK